MKKIIYAAILGCGLSLASCADYLDTDKYFNDTLTFDSLWVNKSYTEGWLANTYFSIWGGNSRKDVRKMDCGPLFWADDLIFGDWLSRNTRNQVFQNGEYTARDQHNNDPWGVFYQGIRVSSLFIMNVDKCLEMSQGERDDAKAQARFVRAYIYYKLIERYGPVPILPEEGLDVEKPYDELGTPRNTMDECVDFVCNELSLAAASLPETRNKSNLIRATKGLALSIRAKMLILAASPLFNSEDTPIYNIKNDNGEKLITPGYSEEKWAKAAAAAKEVIDLGVYELFTVKNTNTTINPPQRMGYSGVDFPQGWANIDPYQSYVQLFDGNKRLGQIKEIIWANDNNNNIYELIEHSLPRYTKAWNCIAVTQKQVDAYQMCDGQDITNSSEKYPYQTEGFYDSNNPDQIKCEYVQDDVSMRYVNREPRFYASIGYNGTVWGCTSSTESGTLYHNYRAQYYKGKPDGKNLSEVEFHPLTGYTLRKYYYDEDAVRLQGAKVCDKYEPIVRYAEVLLWYAEAMNHLSEGKTYDISDYAGTKTVQVSRNIEEMQDCIRPIRVRAGLPDFDDQIYKDQTAFNTALKHERQIEFFGEAKRYYDLNRWLDAMVEQNKPIQGCNMEMSDAEGQKQRFYSPVVISSMPKSFVERQYLWPLPGTELDRNVHLTQNPGW